ncbi:MAG TPA: DUF378 domain-containing protein [Achromobacter sp.]|nr:DUF378 domain-containing protein [uncultured Achromobacter sp.]HBL66373.1 DUF378 domain-containing protein [Achromobacter sp.]
MDMSGQSEDISASEEEIAARPLGRRRDLSGLDWVALIAVVAGGLNCGLIAAVNLDVIARVIPNAAVTRGIQGIIGLAALHCVVMLFRWADEAGEPGEPG